MEQEAKISALPSDRLDDFNGLLYVISKAISNKVNTIELVRVTAVNGSKVNVIPALDKINMDGDRIPSSEIYSVNVFRYQAGENSVIINPEVGDIGLLLICKHDISNFEAGLVIDNGEFNYGDGVYLGGVLGFNKQPTQFIEFESGGITVTTPADLTINAQSATINATEINLGGAGGKKIALDGDPVKSGSTTVGTIQASSVTTKSL